jgi:hypothetical protein
MVREEIIEPNRMVKNDAKKTRSASNNPGNRRISQNTSSGVKKTNIEVLDHETPIELY